MTGQSEPQGPGWWLASDGRYYPPQPQGQYPAAPPPAPTQPQYVMVQNKGTNGLAIASLVLGIIWIYWLGSILAVIFGHVALSQIARSGQNGRGLAIAGLVLGWIGVGVLTIVILGMAAAS